MYLKVVLFWFQGRDHPHKDATSNVATDLKSLISGISKEVSFVSEFQLKQG